MSLEMKMMGWTRKQDEQDQLDEPDKMKMNRLTWAG